MEYSALGNDLTKLEKIEEKKEEDTATGKPAAEAAKVELSAMTEGQRKCAAVFSTLFRRAVCKGIEKTAKDLAGWDLQGYTERVDGDPIVCDSFHTVTEKRLPRALIASPEVIVVTGLASHAHAARQENLRKKKETEPVFNNDITSDGAIIVDDNTAEPSYVDVSDYPIDIEVHEKKPTIDPDDFYLRNQDGQQAEQPKSVFSALTQGRKRKRPSPLVDEEKKETTKRQRKRRKLEDDIANSEFITLMEPEQ